MINDKALVQTKSLLTQLSLTTNQRNSGCLVIAGNTGTWSATRASRICRTAGGRRRWQAPFWGNKQCEQAFSHPRNLAQAPFWGKDVERQPATEFRVLQDNADKFQHNKDLTERRVKAVEDAGASSADERGEELQPSVRQRAGWGPWTP